jgi:hypothetical protein
MRFGALLFALPLALPASRAGEPCATPPAQAAVADLAAAAATAGRAVEVSAVPDPGPIATEVTHLMRGGTDDREERSIMDLLEPLDASTLARVFRLIDQGRDEYDLDHLVYQDVDDPGRRDRLLALLARAGRAEAEAGTLEIAVVSDIDDTAAPQSSAQGTKDWFYGAGTLVQALERGPSGAGQAGDVHYVTARPPLVLGDARGRLDRAGMPEGTLDDGDLGAALFGGQRGLEDEKVRDIERQFSLHPAQRFVLIGDDLQRDPEVYARIRAAHPDRVLGVLIHRVGGKARVGTDAVTFTDYGEAADAAARWGAISEAQRQAVHAAVEARRP